MSAPRNQRRQRAAVSVYAVAGRVILLALTPYDESGAAWTTTDVMVVLDDEVSDDEAGAALAQVLRESLTASPAVGDASEKARLKAAKVRSYRALVKTARYVSVSRDDEGPVRFLPSAPGRRAGGWITVGEEDAIVCGDPSPTSLGRTLRQAIEASTTTPVDD